MKRNGKKLAALTLLAGTFLPQFGCINLSTVWQAALYYGALEFVADNDAVFDLFEDGNVAAAE